MNMIDTSAGRIARIIRKNYPDAASEAVLTYSLIILLNSLTTILLTLIVCMFTGRFLEAVYVLLACAFLRFFTGGVHLNSSLVCALASSVLLVGLAHVRFDFWPAGIILNSIALILVLFLAPSGIEGVARLNPKYYPMLKGIAVIIVSANYAIHSSLLSAVFFSQAVTLTKPAYMLVDLMEGRKMT